MRVARLVDDEHHWATADEAAALWDRDGAVFVRSSASHVFVADDLVIRMAPLSTPQAVAVARSATTAESLAAAGAPVPASVTSTAGLLVEEVDGMVVTALPVVPGDPVDDLAFALRAWTPPGGTPDLEHEIPRAFLAGYREVRDVDLSLLPAAARAVAHRTLASYDVHAATPADPDWPDWARRLHVTVAERAAELRSAL